jgi:RNA polymerase sigma-70 factor (ECF subfamily)
MRSDDAMPAVLTAPAPSTGLSPSLRELAVAAQAHGGAATDTLFARVQDLALSYARARLGRFGAADVAQDVAQEVCMALLRALATYDDRGYPFEAFVYSICSRKVADAQRGILRSAQPMAQLPDVTDEAPGPEAVVLVRDHARRARQLILRLPQTQKQVLVLRVEFGLSTEETAASLRMSVGAVRVAQHRALVRLREQLDPAQEDLAS